MEKLTARSSADKNEDEDNYAGCEYVCNPGSVSPTLQPHLCFSAEVSALTRLDRAAQSHCKMGCSHIAPIIPLASLEGNVLTCILCDAAFKWGLTSPLLPTPHTSVRF